MCHRLHHMLHRFVRPRNPVNPLIQHFVKTAHWLCRGYETSPLFRLRLTHNRGMVSPYPSLTLGEAASFRCYST